MEMQQKHGRIELVGDFSATVDPRDWKQLKEEEEEEKDRTVMNKTI